MKDGAIGARKEAKSAAKMRPGWMPQRKPLISPMKKDTKMDIEKVVHEIRRSCKGRVR